MSIQSFLQRLLILLIPLSTLSTTYLYLYPIFHGCAFPSTASPPSQRASFLSTIYQHTSPSIPGHRPAAPFRLLAYGDPQLEGNTKLPDPTKPLFPSLSQLLSPTQNLTDTTPLGLPQRIATALLDLFARDLPRFLRGWRKRIDLLGNDLYLAHNYRTLLWWTQPTHVTVLGDLLGSQWVSNEEFERRGRRFWDVVFRGGRRVEDEIMERGGGAGGYEEVLGGDERWRDRIINIPGNHDVGYAGDMGFPRVERFEKMFGRANWDITFRLPPSSSSSPSSSESSSPPLLRLIILNDLLLDSPAYSPDLQQHTYDALNEIIMSSHAVDRPAHFTILLTHVPLHKPAGVCADEPFISYQPDYFGGGVKEQNHLSPDAGKGILEGIFGMSADRQASGGGMGRSGVILNGHDHVGCDTYHFLDPVEGLPEGVDPRERPWRAMHVSNMTTSSLPRPGVREITVRSMMGDFGGNAGLLSVWFEPASSSATDPDTAGEWRFEYTTCSLGRQHIWWAVHVVDLITLVFGSVVMVGWLASSRTTDGATQRKTSTRRARGQHAGHARFNGAVGTVMSREEVLSQAHASGRMKGDGGGSQRRRTKRES
ncbi:MAG: hypothetical protein M1817_002244 [Caeruleum heppii]|nr:MAG: hypothetical protein M1817_002244 [Caeruleum heppii]